MQVGSKEEGSFPEEHQLELAKDSKQAFGARFWREKGAERLHNSHASMDLYPPLISQEVLPSNE